MPQELKAEDINSKTDPSVAKQWDDSSSTETKFNDLYAITDKLKVCLLGTYRKGIGPVSRSMAVGKRVGPDFLFLANKHSQKFSDLEANQETQITFQNSSSQDWVSISGTATAADNSDPRIKELYNPGVSAWFGDLGDGKHDGTPNDPRMALIEIKAKYISYWKAQVGFLGYAKEVAQAAITGKVADVGVQRHMMEDEIEQERSRSRNS
ncbi:hypothetical protein H2201_007585 [Coniosporium apollinis]|uniref:General stress protein FMN-binding split barrel domain-containing protein n=1 Tax=Coniosporium apollinis TaxID=61459 RepID=A0ABQ9NIZ0_9PEZI|nr:hypothetical protein H2201_007585 [Coniosporium apollinis]